MSINPNTPSEHVVIIGGSSGIGLATARTLINQGYRVSIAGRSIERLKVASKQLDDLVEIVVMDARDTETIRHGFDTIGNFNHLVLALGSTGGVGEFVSVAPEDVRRGFEEKVFAHFATAQASLPFLIQNGSITFVSAVTAHAAMPGTAGIGAANAAIAALIPTLAVELKPIRVNGVSPGVIDTPWWGFLDDKVKASVFTGYAAKTPVGRVGVPEDVADTIAFLICNNFISGEVIVCDGGLRLVG